MQIDLSQFQIAEVAEIQSSLNIEQSFFVPGPSSEDDLTATTAEIEYNRDNCIGGEVYITPKYSECRTSLLFRGHEFLAIMAFLVDEGLLIECAVDADPDEDEDSLQPDCVGDETPPATNEPGTGDPEPAIPLSVALLEDQDWLYQKHVVEGLSMAEMGRLVGRTGSTVKARLIKYGIEIQYKRGQRTDKGAGVTRGLGRTPATLPPHTTTEVEQHSSAIIARAHERTKKSTLPPVPAPWLEDIVNGDEA